MNLCLRTSSIVDKIWPVINMTELNVTTRWEHLPGLNQRSFPGFTAVEENRGDAVDGKG